MVKKENISKQIEVNEKKVYVLAEHKKNPDYVTKKQQVFIIGSKGIPANYSRTSSRRSRAPLWIIRAVWPAR